MIQIALAVVAVLFGVAIYAFSIISKIYAIVVTAKRDDSMFNH